MPRSTDPTPLRLIATTLLLSYVWKAASLRSRDMRDGHVWPGGGKKTFTVPQIIFRDISEFSILTDAVASAGYKRIDLNMGCPFVPQMKKDEELPFPANIDNLHDIASAITNIGERISFSVKMRLGTDSPKLWRHTIEILNTVPLSHICVHPRTARQASIPGICTWQSLANCWKYRHIR